jgi:heptosyltransferase II
MVMATPFLRSLRRSLDDELWAIGKSKGMHIYNGLDLFDRYIPNDDKSFVRFLDTVSHLRAVGFDRGIVLPHSFRSALLFFSGAVRERIGYARNKRGFMLTKTAPEAKNLEPTVEHYLRLVDLLGGARSDDAPVLSVTEDEERKFDERYIDIQRGFVAFIVGAQYGSSKMWPDSHFSELADLIISRFRRRVYILPGGKGEKLIAEKVRQGATNKDDIEVKDLDIRDLKVCLSRASLVVTNDTGPRHISVALNRPTVVLIGPMDERYTVYPAASSATITKDVPCRPCNKKRCDGDHACMKDITPAQVFHKIEEMLVHDAG